jgi:hypothetical protein
VRVGHGGILGCKRFEDGQEGLKMARGFEDGRRVRRWQEGSKMAGGFEDGRRVRRWQEGSEMAGGFEDGRCTLVLLLYSRGMVVKAASQA